jgi:hypothetical protein
MKYALCYFSSMKNLRAFPLVATLLALAGCGSTGRPPPAGDSSYASPDSVGGDGSFGSLDSGTAVPLCGKKGDGSYCDCVDVPLFTDPPNLYFVLDRSGSMADGGKWDQVRSTMATVLRALGPRANFGAEVFPGFASESCAAPVEVMPMSPGDPPGSDGPTTRTFLARTSDPPSGGTPTAEALRQALPTLKTLTGHSFVILATDGGPNCNGAAGCGYDACIPNIEDQPGCPSVGPRNCCEVPVGMPESCLDEGPSIAAVSALKLAGFPTYVVGIPGSAPYANVLDALAVAGGTAQSTSPKYYAVSVAGSQDLLSTLKKVAAKIIATCEHKLTTVPADPDLVNVYLDEVLLPKDPTQGWTIDGDTVTLLGSACTRVLDGDVLGVRIVAGCPTVHPR